MARKKAKKATTRRRRRVSGVGAVTKGIGGMLINAAAATAGYVGANLIGKMIPLDNKLAKGGAKIALGVVTTKFIKGNTGAALGLGMSIAGVVDVAQQFAPGLVSGIGEDEPVLLISGVGEIDELGAIDTIGEVNTLGEVNEIGEVNELGGIATLGGF